MIVNRYVVGMYQTNCYLLIDEKTKYCAIVDPGDINFRMNEDIKSNGYIVKYIIFTHGHFDHIGAMEYYMSEFDEAVVFMHKNDVSSVLSEYDVFSVKMNNKTETVKKITLHNDGDVLRLGNIDLEIIHTPGHSKGSVCIYTDGILISGDTLFQHSIGRTDFIDGDFGELKKSVIDKLYKLPDETVVYPGHGDSTVISEEKNCNPYVRV